MITLSLLGLVNVAITGPVLNLLSGLLGLHASF
jgi:hypothetical protein